MLITIDLFVGWDKNDDIASRVLTFSLYFIQPGVRGTVRAKFFCPISQLNVPGQGSDQPGPLDPETSALIMRPMCFPWDGWGGGVICSKDRGHTLQYEYRDE